MFSRRLARDLLNVGGVVIVVVALIEAASWLLEQFSL